MQKRRWKGEIIRKLLSWSFWRADSNPILVLIINHWFICLFHFLAIFRYFFCYLHIFEFYFAKILSLASFTVLQFFLQFVFSLFSLNLFKVVHRKTLSSFNFLRARKVASDFENDLNESEKMRNRRLEISLMDVNLDFVWILYGFQITAESRKPHRNASSVTPDCLRI